MVDQTSSVKTWTDSRVALTISRLYRYARSKDMVVARCANGMIEELERLASRFADALEEHVSR